MSEDLRWAGVAGQAAAIAAGDTSSEAVVAASLDRIAAFDGELNAFTNVFAERALQEARERDAVSPLGRLHGVPLAIKEEIDVEGAVSTFGTAANTVPAIADGEVVRRLRAAGAVIVGKTNMPEFGLWPFTESTAHGPTRNPWNRANTPGGSSGGTAAAVAAGLVPGGIGGDGGGSIRIPSACTGLFGLKPQRGRVTQSPQPHLWWSLGTTGPLTRSVVDSALIYDVISGAMPTDLYSAPDPASNFVEASRREPGRLRIGWSTKAVTLGVKPDPEHVREVEEMAALLEGLGHQVEQIDPHYPDPTAAFIPQFFAGLRSEIALVEDAAKLESRTRQTAKVGGWVRPGVRDWAIRQGEKVSVKANRVFERCDVLLTPTIAHRPPEVGVLTGKGFVGATLASMPMIAYCALWNVAGNPAAAVPAGFGTDGLPLSVQLVGRTNDEATLFSLSAQIERAKPWADARPEL
jgi:amidase